MSDDQKGGKLEGYLKSLDEAELDDALNEVLTEIRRRESDQMKKDVLTHSQSLRLYKLTR